MYVALLWLAICGIFTTASGYDEASWQNSSSNELAQSMSNQIDNYAFQKFMGGARILKWPEMRIGGTTVDSGSVDIKKEKKNMRVDPLEKTEGYRWELLNHGDFKNPLLSKILRNHENFIFVKETKEVIYYDPNVDSWYIHKYKETTSETFVSKDRFPIAKCVNSNYGGAGYVSPLIEMTVSATVGVSGTVLFSDVFRVDGLQFSATKGVSLSKSVRYSGSVTCLFNKGQYCQAYIRPYYFLVPQGERCKVHYSQRKGLVVKGEYEETAPFKKMVAVPPMVECSVGEDAAVCASEVVPGVSVGDFDTFLKERYGR